MQTEEKSIKKTERWGQSVDSDQIVDPFMLSHFC
jgi:hypothetical protein